MRVDPLSAILREMHSPQIRGPMALWPSSLHHHHHLWDQGLGEAPRLQSSSNEAWSTVAERGGVHCAPSSRESYQGLPGSTPTLTSSQHIPLLISLIPIWYSHFCHFLFPYSSPSNIFIPHFCIHKHSFQILPRPSDVLTLQAYMDFSLLFCSYIQFHL